MGSGNRLGFCAQTIQKRYKAGRNLHRPLLFIRVLDGPHASNLSYRQAEWTQPPVPRRSYNEDTVQRRARYFCL